LLREEVLRLDFSLVLLVLSFPDVRLLPLVNKENRSIAMSLNAVIGQFVSDATIVIVPNLEFELRLLAKNT